MNDTWLGLRDEDLDEAELAARDARLLHDVDARRSHEDALSIGRRLAALPDQPALGAPPRRRPWGLVTGALAVGLAAAWLLAPRVPPQDLLRARGGGSTDADLVLRAVAEGGGAPRKLTDGALVGPDEQVVFEVETGAEGELVVDEVGERTTRVWPVGATWEVDAGRHFVGGAHALAWRADEPGLHQYMATFCPSSGGPCTTTSLTLRWSGP